MIKSGKASGSFIPPILVSILQVLICLFSPCRRYVREKAAYKGPHQITKRRAKKHPLAPKRPMSAFLKFSQVWRQRIKNENPDVANTDVSRLLGEMWRNASHKEKAPYREEELRERAVYKENIQRFRDGQARKDAASRTSHQAVQGYRHSSSAPDYSQRSYSTSMNSSFETLRLDSFDETLKQSSYRSHSQYNNSYLPYRQTYPMLSGK